MITFFLPNLLTEFHRNEKITPCKPPPPEESSEGRAPLPTGHLDHSKRLDPLFVLWLPLWEAQKGLQWQGLPRGWLHSGFLELKRKGVWCPKRRRNDCSNNNVLVITSKPLLMAMISMQMPSQATPHACLSEGPIYSLKALLFISARKKSSSPSACQEHGC